MPPEEAAGGAAAQAEGRRGERGGGSPGKGAPAGGPAAGREPMGAAAPDPLPAALCQGEDACGPDEVCVRPGVCLCKPGFFGADCSSRECFPRAQPPPPPLPAWVLGGRGLPGCRRHPPSSLPLSLRRLPRAVLGSRLQAELPVPPQRALRPGQRALLLRPQPLGRALPVPLPVRPPRPLRPPHRRLPLRAGLVGTHLQEAVSVQPRQLPLRPAHRPLPLPAGLVGQEVQLQMLLQPLALRPGDGQVRVQGWVLGADVPAALRLRARLLQPPQRPLQLQPRLPGQELPGAVSGGEIRVSVRSQVSWEQPAGSSGSPGATARPWRGKDVTLVSVPLAAQGHPSQGV